ncbi:MAG TPA: alpha-L-arabinofuranosidase C-terminal domain-containing protein, partial [Arachnia sp.]|nr:alpha-L-arabinofuranosidase C-terminal domain-containing protein [Arachnia sp.]
APIMTEPGGPAWKQTTFHPFALTSRYARGNVLEVPIASPTYDTAKYGTVPLVDAVATHDPETGDVALFLVNRSIDAPIAIEVDLGGLDGAALVEAVELSNPDHLWAASMEDSTSVAPKELADVSVVDGVLSAALPPVSWAMVRLSSR